MKKLYFNKEFIQFFSNLRVHNSKEWFDANRGTYEEQVKKPFLHFVADALAILSKYEPVPLPDPKKCIFRINRDIRFSANKTPYKTNVSAIISSASDKSLDIPSFYIDFSDTKLMMGGGAYFIDNKILPNVREYIVNNYDDYLKLIGDKAFKDFYGEIKGEENKRLPSAFKGLENKYPEILKKQFYFMKEFEPTMLLSKDLSAKFEESIKSGIKFNQFLYKAFQHNS